jgi:cellulose synthase/poly-beta-1,6-N-acetylglucosamine synthase-like glycosyltransferase
MNNKTETNKNMIRALVAVLLIFIVVYFVLRALFISYAQYNQIEKTLGILFFLSEAYVMVHAFGYFMGIYRLNKKGLIEPEVAYLEEYPHVSILIPARHEPKEILESTVTSCYNLAYPAKTIYILDDSSEQEYMDQAQAIAEKFDCTLFRREERHGAKAGVINDCMKNIDSKYIAVFDVDQNPISGFLTKAVSVLEADSKLAFIQTPQYYSNLHANRVARAANMQQAAFYETVCEAKSASDAMMCCGTNVVLRKEALDDVGGLDESTVTEDFATSFQLHLKGWKSIYYNHIGTFGQGPENLSVYLNQQNRWANGNVSVLKKVALKLLRNPLALKPIQWWEYSITGSYYLVGWALLFLLFCPVIYIFFDTPSFFMHPAIYAMAFVPYFTLALTIFYMSMKGRNYKSKDIFKGQMLFLISLPAYLSGSLAGLLGLKKGFKITAKKCSQHVPYRTLWPQLFIWGASLSAITWGVNRFIYDRSPAVLINMAWIFYHFVLLSSIFYFNEEVLEKSKV